MANDYENLRTSMVGICTVLDKVRKNIRYHVTNPNLNLLTDLCIDEIRKQLDEIETRACTNETSEPHKNVKPFDILPDPEVLMADTTTHIAELVDCICAAQQASAASAPLLYIDCEGDNLGRRGTITLLQIYVPAKEIVYIVDIQTLKAKAFRTSGHNNNTNLKTLLEAPTPVKVLWDCRADSDALFAHCGVALSGVIDAQLVENATSPKRSSNKRLSALIRCVEARLNLSAGKLTTFSETKAMGRLAMREGIDFAVKHHEKVGDEESGYRWIAKGDADEENRVKESKTESPMAERPLHQYMLDYCAQDVTILPLILERCLESKFWSAEWEGRVTAESNARLTESRAEDYDPEPKTMNRPPMNWTYLTREDQTMIAKSGGDAHDTPPLESGVEVHTSAEGTSNDKEESNDEKQSNDGVKET